MSINRAPRRGLGMMLFIERNDLRNKKALEERPVHKKG
jgi:hypothetical protein